MRKDELLQDAIGFIRDDLIVDAKQNGTKKTGFVRLLPKIAVAAACISVFAIGWLLLSKSRPLPPAKNLWERADFQVYSLIYSNSTAQDPSLGSSSSVVFLSQTEEGLPENTVTASPLVITGDSTVKVESLIGGRYVAYISNTGAPIFFDTQEGVAVDMKKRILGDDVASIDSVLAVAEQIADQNFPGMIKESANRQYLLEIIRCFADRTQVPDAKDWGVDTAFLDSLDVSYQYLSEEERYIQFEDMCWSVYLDAMGRVNDDRPYRVRFVSIDAYSGKCIVQIRDMAGNVLSVQLYDMATDSVLCSLSGGTWNSSCVRYSLNGKLLTVAYNESISTAAGMPDADYTERHKYADTKLGIGRYMGESVYVVDSSTGWVSETWSGAASEGFLSKSGKVCYFKQIPPECVGKGFYTTSGVWMNRLVLFGRDTDSWVFYTQSGEDPYGKETVLQGNFVRFMAEETIAVMERDGQYYAYLLSTGKDITQKVQQGKYAVVPHERLQIFSRDGILYKQDMFSGEPAQVIAQADWYVLSSDGAFAFVYCNGSDYAQCYNVATLESCNIGLDAQLRSQLSDAQGAVFQMVYNDEENTLTLSFYLEEDAHQDNAVDFFGLLAELESESYWDNEIINPKRYTEFTVSEEIMEQFRWSVYQRQHPDGVMTWEWYYPESLPIYLDRFQLFAALDITPPEDYLDVNGTEFVLYEDGDEKLSLIFYKFWGLYDYPQDLSGFCILYETGGQTYSYDFYNPQ